MCGPGRLELHGARQHIVVAMLLLNPNRQVSMDRLLEAVYGEDLPPTARSQVQISISSLRRLFAACDRDEVISTRAGGYEIQVGDGELDSRRFETLLANAREARESGNYGLAVARFRDAVRLWRGPALEGIDSQLVRSAASRLDELGVGANEDRITLELDLGRHHELIGELTEMVGEYPLREALRGQLMLALYRCDRVAEALAVYQDTRRTMIEELGIDPSDRLQELEQEGRGPERIADRLAGRVDGKRGHELVLDEPDDQATARHRARVERREPAEHRPVSVFVEAHDDGVL